jgi:hypothetical protein
MLQILLALGAFSLASRWLAAAASAIGLPSGMVSLATALV